MTEKNSWNVYRTRFLVRARQLTEPLVFTDLFNREQSGQPGDYLVEASDGIRRIIGRALFEDIYVPLAADPAPPSLAGVQKRPPSSDSADSSASLFSDARARASA